MTNRISNRAAALAKGIRYATIVGNFMGSVKLDAGAEASLEQLKQCDAELLLTMRPLKLKEVLAYMGVDYSAAVEKRGRGRAGAEGGGKLERRDGACAGGRRRAQHGGRVGGNPEPE